MPTQEEVQAAALAWIKERWGEDRACSICGHTNWGVGESLGLKAWPVPDLFRAFGGNPGVYPVIPVVCTYCGHTQLLNGVTAGIFPARTQS